MGDTATPETGTGTCFVMQPFDGDKYDKRYKDTFAPAIEETGLTPYRVDRDAGVSIPIDDIESGIRTARLCFAEITTDNPNVWFELGFAISAAKDAVLICSEERTSRFPFDVQHRNIIKYRCGAPQDFTELQKKITERITALLKKSAALASTLSAPVQETEGLSSHEVVGLIATMENQFVFGYAEALNIRKDMSNAGFTRAAAALAMRGLELKGMVDREMLAGEDRLYATFHVTAQGERWLLANQNLLTLRKPMDEVPF